MLLVLFLLLFFQHESDILNVPNLNHVDAELFGFVIIPGDEYHTEDDCLFEPRHPIILIPRPSNQVARNNDCKHHLRVGKGSRGLVVRRLLCKGAGLESPQDQNFVLVPFVLSLPHV